MVWIGVVDAAHGTAMFKPKEDAIVFFEEQQNRFLLFFFFCLPQQEPNVDRAFLSASVNRKIDIFYYWLNS